MEHEIIQYIPTIVFRGEHSLDEIFMQRSETCEWEYGKLETEIYHYGISAMVSSYTFAIIVNSPNKFNEIIMRSEKWRLEDFARAIARHVIYDYDYLISLMKMSPVKFNKKMLFEELFKLGCHPLVSYCERKFAALD